MTTDVFDFTVTDSSLIGLLQKINSFTDVGQGGILGIFVLIVVGGSLLMMMRGFGNERSFSVTSLVLFIVAILLRIMNFITDLVLGVCVALGIIGIIYLIKEQGQYE